MDVSSDFTACRRKSIGSTPPWMCLLISLLVVEGVMADRRISKRLKGKVMNYNSKDCMCAKTTGYGKQQE